LGQIGRRQPKAGGETPRRNRGLILLFIVLCVGAIGGSTLAVVLHQKSASSTAPVGPARYSVIFMIDGVGASDLGLASMPNVRALERQGVRYDEAWVGQLEPSTVASNATLATGVFPREHGLLGDIWNDVHSRRPDSAATPAQIRLGSFDQIIESHGVKTLPALLKAHDPTGRVLSVGGTGCAAASAAATRLGDYVLCAARFRHRWVAATVAGHDPPAGFLRNSAWRVPVAAGNQIAPQLEGWQLGQQDDWVARAAVWGIRHANPRVTIINLPEASILGRWIPAARRAAVLGQLMAGIDRDIGMVIQELRRERRLNQTVFVLTSDQAIAATTHQLPTDSIDQAILAAGGEKVYLRAEASALIGLRDRLQSAPVAETLESVNGQETDAIYYKVPGAVGWTYRRQYVRPNLVRRFGGAIEYLLGTLASDASPDVIVAYAPATAATGQVGQFRSTGAGLGFQWVNQHIPLILSGHGVQMGLSSSYPARLVDVLPTVGALMGFDAGGDGTVLADALEQSAARDTTRQRQTAAWLQPLVEALQRRAAHSMR
jgi:arylsulfatase A-like enzyme